MMMSRLAVSFIAALLFCVSIAVDAQIVGVKPVLTGRPRAGVPGVALDPAPVVEIHRQDTNAVYTCQLTVSVVLYTSPMVNYGTPAPVLSGTTSYSSATGSVTLNNLLISKAGAFYQLTYSISAVVEGTTLTWTKYSAAFNIAGTPAPTAATAAPTTPAPATPAPPPVTRPPNENINVVASRPEGVVNCEAFATQPNIELINTTSQTREEIAFEVLSTTINTPDGTSSTLSGTRTWSGTNGFGSYTDLQTCGDVGTGFSLSHQVRFMGRTVTVQGGAFSVSGTNSPMPATPAPPSPAPATPSVDLTNAVARFHVQPGSGVAGALLRWQPVVRFEKRYEQALIATSATAVMTLDQSRFGGASWGAVLGGTTTVTSSTGTFTFTDLFISKLGYGYNLKVTITCQSQDFVAWSQAVYITSATNNHVEERPQMSSAGNNGTTTFISSPNVAAGGGAAAGVNAPAPTTTTAAPVGAESSSTASAKGATTGNADGKASNQRSEGRGSNTASSLEREKFLIIVMVVVACVAMVIPVVVFVITRQHYANALEKAVQKHQKKYEGVPLTEEQQPKEGDSLCKTNKKPNPVAATFASYEDEDYCYGEEDGEEKEELTETQSSTATIAEPVSHP